MARSGEHRVLFAGGGTGGHLMPAINIALELKRRDGALKALFIGKISGMEAPIVRRFGFDIREIEVAGLRRNPAGLVRFLWKWRKGLRQALDIVREFDPLVVVGTGGYVSAPVVRAAHKMGQAIYLQEQNSLPGLATRTLSRFANTVFIAYERAARYLPAQKCHLSGNPVRPDLLDAKRETAQGEFGLDRRKKTLLVVGGSSGARGINSAILGIVQSGAIPGDWQVLWQVGQKEFAELTAKIPEGKLAGKCLPFIDNMPGAYAAADLIVARAGAMTLAEIAIWGLPSILVPYPFATGDHQTLNAREFETAGAAALIPEERIGEKFAEVLTVLFSDDNKRRQMAGASKKLARPEAAGIIAQTILDKINEI